VPFLGRALQNEQNPTETPLQKIDPLIHKSADAVKTWQKHNLFKQK
tara:strand:- start:196 stop:333 length:138 start_codon:yes stop_codon:yes gene_type:complete